MDEVVGVAAPTPDRRTVLLALIIVLTIAAAGVLVFVIVRPLSQTDAPGSGIRIPGLSLTLSPTVSKPESDYGFEFTGNGSAVRGVRIFWISEPATPLDVCVDTYGNATRTFQQCQNSSHPESWAALPNLTTCLWTPPTGFAGLSLSVVVPGTATGVVVSVEVQVNDTPCTSARGDVVATGSGTLTPISRLGNSTLAIPLSGLPPQRSELELWLNSSSAPIIVSAEGIPSSGPTTEAAVTLVTDGKTLVQVEVEYSSTVPVELTVQGVAFG